jgi:hypothetical protein
MLRFPFDKPHQISWLAIPLLLIIGFVYQQHTIDIQLYDTYFVIDMLMFAQAGSGLLFVTGVVYWLLDRWHKRTNKQLSGLHLLLLFGSLASPTLPILSDQFLNAPWLLGNLLIFALAQFLFIVNVISSLFRKSAIGAK